MRHFAILLFAVMFATSAAAEPPGLSYIFPAGGQGGTEVRARVGGFYLHQGGPLELSPADVTASDLQPTARVWFEGPVIKQPASQQKEDYPRDYLTTVTLPENAAPGVRALRTWNAQGITPPLRFVVGDFPEVIEAEAEGRPVPQRVSLPITVNGRVFPREDVDVWQFEAQEGESITCATAAVELGSPLETRLELRDADNRVLAEAIGGVRSDPVLRFKAPRSGVYRLQVCDARYSGGQNLVYRVTITRGVWMDRVFPLGGRAGETVRFDLFGQATPANAALTLPATIGPQRLPFTVAGERSNLALVDVDTLPEVIEADTSRGELPLPGIANGRVSAPEEIDAWPFTALKGRAIKFELRAAKLNSPLMGVILVKDASGKEVARANEPAGNAADPELEFTPAADGAYVVEISDRFASRGGPAFAYRLKATVVEPDFQLTHAAESAAVNIGGEFKLPVNVVRRGGFKAPVEIAAEGLPGGVTAATVTAAAGQNRVELIFKATAETPVQIATIQLVGRAEGLERFAEFLPPSGPRQDVSPSALPLACTLPTPFKFKGNYELRYIARGASLTKRFDIERNGFVGPLEVTLADRQGRHLQGVTGPITTIPADRDDFEYTISLPPWMELGRTSRTNLMLTGIVKDATGKAYPVSFVTNEQNEQLIALVSPGPLALAVERPTVVVERGREIVIPFKLLRQPGVDNLCRVDVIVPSGMGGVQAEPAQIRGDSGEIRLRATDSAGPFLAPIVLRATAQRDGEPVTAEASLELIPGRESRAPRGE